MRLSLDALQVLDAIARGGSFAAAATELHRVPSAITYKVQQLEQDLDVLLFDRRGHRAKLTGAGFELLTEGRQLLRAATDLECRIQQVAKGWETELRIAIDTIIDPQRLFSLLAEFDKEASGTRIKIMTEVLGGNWDALISGRADLVIGASSDVPSGGGYATIPLGKLQFAFVAAPTHPICLETQPLSEATILKYRAVSVADSSRNLPVRTVGLLSGQDVLTMPSMLAKIDAHVAGLGVGFLPLPIAKFEERAGRLKILDVEIGKPGGETVIAWRPNRTGKALRWFIKQFQSADTIQSLLFDDHPQSAGKVKRPSAATAKSK